MKTKNNIPIYPSKENIIGILGGGQLGKMIALTASRLGFPTCLYCQKGDNPAENAVSNIIHGDWNDEDKLNEFADKVVCATSEFENIPSKTLKFLSKKTLVYPNSLTFKTAQSRDFEKKIASKAGFNVPKWFKINSFNELKKYSKALNYKAILKTNTLGYDGKGQKVISKKDDLEDLWIKTKNSDYILEEKINFKREISLLYARSSNLSECFFPISENFHENGILKRTFAPTKIDINTKIKLMNLSRKLSDLLGLVGLLTIEMFELNDGTIIFNEMAPRPHNSFHWTIEGCNRSQFDVLIRSILGHQINDVCNYGTWEMENILGEEINKLNHFYLKENCFPHIYGKIQIKPGRKMGHITKKLN